QIIWRSVRADGYFESIITAHAHPIDSRGDRELDRGGDGEIVRIITVGVRILRNAGKPLVAREETSRVSSLFIVDCRRFDIKAIIGGCISRLVGVGLQGGRLN